MSAVYADLPAAMIGHLRATPAVVSGFAEDTNTPATTKFWADAARRGVALPWAVYEELGGEVRAMTRAGGVAPTIEAGRLRFTVVAEGKAAARGLARLLARTLDDAPLVFSDGVLMYLRARVPRSVPVGDLAPGSPAASALVVDFDVMVQRTA